MAKKMKYSKKREAKKIVRAVGRGAKESMYEHRPKSKSKKRKR
jgi:hypothetical protein